MPRVDIPGDWVDFVVQRPSPHYIEPLFTRDPAQITEIQVLMAMMAIKGIYAEYGVQRLNHGIGFDTAAIELLLPTYGESLGLKGKICRHWALNPHPALIPAIEAGWVESIHSFGSELGMEDYVRARPDVFFTGPRRQLRTNRAFCQAAGHYACDLFIGSTLQIDLQGNSSTATLGPHRRLRRRAEHGRRRARAPPRQRRVAQGGRGRRATAWPAARMPRGRKLVVQIVETFREHMQPAFVERLDAWELAEQAGHGAAAGHDLRRRRHPHPDRGRHRQPAAVPQRRGARAGDPRRRRLHAGGPGARPRAWSRTCASAASSAAPEDLGIDRATGHARPARRALDQGPGARVRRPVRSAERFRNW